MVDSVCFCPNRNRVITRRHADSTSELPQDIFGKDKSPCRLVYGIASVPLGTPVELEVIFEVSVSAHL
jgi:hypothetical protein